MRELTYFKLWKWITTFLGISLIIILLWALNSYIFNLEIVKQEFEKYTPIFFPILIPLLIALFTFGGNFIIKKRGEINNQIKIIEGLIAEIDIVSSPCSETLFDNSKGNIDWYEEEIQRNNVGRLDHKINKINFQSYPSSIDSSLCEIISVPKLIRSLSYINDKIEEINFHVGKSRENAKYFETYKQSILNIISELRTKSEITKDKLRTQAEYLRKL